MRNLWKLARWREHAWFIIKCGWLIVSALHLLAGGSVLVGCTALVCLYLTIIVERLERLQATLNRQEDARKIRDLLREIDRELAARGES